MQSSSKKQWKDRTVEECTSWAQRVHQVQTERMTPEMRASLLERVEQQRQHEMTRKKCKAVKSHAVRSRALCAEGLRQMSAAGADHSRVQASWSAANEASAARQNMQLMSLSVPAIAEQAPSMAAALADDSDSEEEAGMNQAVAMVGGDATAMREQAANTVAAPGGARNDGVADLLAQLRTEPDDCSECAAKFQLYEEYANQVEQMRMSVFDLHRESEPQLPDAVKRDMQKQLKSIDNNDNLGIPDETREWFVFHMMKAAEKNNRGMASILESFEKRLEFLAKNDQTECPVCFETFAAGTGHEAETLGCCHKICKECWEHWTQVANPPFCPLCRNEDFLGVVMGRARRY